MAPRSTDIRQRRLGPPTVRACVPRSRRTPVGRAAPAPDVPHASDRALYTCSAGHAFQATVSTSVSCPRCGEPQAW